MAVRTTQEGYERIQRFKRDSVTGVVDFLFLASRPPKAIVLEVVNFLHTAGQPIKRVYRPKTPEVLVFRRPVGQ